MTEKLIDKKLIEGIIVNVIIVIIVLVVLGDTGSDVGAAADNITAQSDVYPLTSFFKKKGIILLAFMAGIALTIILAVLPKKGK